ncbi:MAG TPA: hypothetical protein VFN67_26405 [Polyangiales bacterium]|nr:hypothetical protein [Polyangiales bacterium]
MSDDNYRKPSSPRATRIGLGLVGTDAPYRANSGLAEVESDTRYMEPPSETHGVERDELVRRLREDTEASAARGGTGHHGLFGSTLRAHTVERAPSSGYAHEEDMQPQAEAGDPGLFRAALDNTVRAQPVAAQQISTRPPPPPAPSRAPEAWRDEVRRMVERAPSKGPTSSHAGPPSQSPGGMGGFGGPNTPGGSSLPPAPTHKPSLRLKLDADVAEEQVYRAPKSALPKLLLWLVILGMLGGGFWLYAESRGGVAALIQQLQGGQPTVTPQTPTPALVTVDPAAAPQQPPAAAAPTAAAVPAQPSGAPPTTPRAAAPSGTPAAPSNTPAAPSSATAAPSGTAAAPSAPKAQAPSPPKAQPPSNQEQTAEPAPAAAPKPAAPKAPPRQVRPQQPVVKVRPIESAPSTAEPAAPGAAEPLDIPYVPLPGDPPAPDEAR